MNILLLSFPDPHLLDSVKNEIFYYLCRKRGFLFSFYSWPLNMGAGAPSFQAAGNLHVTPGWPCRSSLPVVCGFSQARVVECSTYYGKKHSSKGTHVPTHVVPRSVLASWLIFFYPPWRIVSWVNFMCCFFFRLTAHLTSTCLGL